MNNNEEIFIDLITRLEQLSLLLKDFSYSLENLASDFERIGENLKFEQLGQILQKKQKE